MVGIKDHFEIEYIQLYGNLYCLYFYHLPPTGVNLIIDRASPVD
jgi:hypothetical protein